MENVMDKRQQVIAAIQASGSWWTARCIAFIKTLPSVKIMGDVILPVSMMWLHQ